jgi:hypothetical protein
MERREGPQTPYEVYCHNCRVTFPVGTQRCVHCGRPQGGSARPGLAGLVEPRNPGRPAGLEENDAELAEANPLRRAGGISLWVLIALGAALARMCGGQ